MQKGRRKSFKKRFSFPFRVQGDQVIEESIWQPVLWDYIHPRDSFPKKAKGSLGIKIQVKSASQLIGPLWAGRSLKHPYATKAQDSAGQGEARNACWIVSFKTQLTLAARTLTIWVERNVPPFLCVCLGTHEQKQPLEHFISVGSFDHTWDNTTIYFSLSTRELEVSGISFLSQ